jgi:hypothetical protein
MSNAEMLRESAVEPSAATVDMKLEVVVPVSNVDHAERFYGDLGWRLDINCTVGDDYRVIQFAPPGSGCSIIFGKNVTAAAPGSTAKLPGVPNDPNIKSTLSFSTDR